jgi:tight adherence protein C
MNRLISLIFAVLVYSEVFFILRLISTKVTFARLKSRRGDLLKSYIAQNVATLRKTPIQVAITAKLFDSYGDRLIRDDYKAKLQTMLINSGVLEGDGFTALVRRKFIFAIGGFGTIFIFLLLKSFSSLPIILGLTAFGYFLPNLADIGNRMIGRGYKNRLENLLNSAGDWESNHYITLIKRKVIYGFVSIVISYLYLVYKNQNFSALPFSLFIISLGFFLPDILLQNKVIKRKEMIARTLPDAIDMLLMCVSAGLAFPAALTKVAETQSGPIAEEFSRVTKEVQLGQSRSDALIAMARRTNEPHVQKFVSAMVQVDRFGIPVTSVLSEQSTEMRAGRRESAREQGQKVPLKILAPIMLCFLPCVLIIILGPAVLGIIRTFSG